MLPPQLHLGGPETLCAEGVVPVPPTTPGSFPTVKPRGAGLWTSTYLGVTGSDWVRWCLSEEFGLDRSDPRSDHPWLLTPDPEARIFEVASYWDLADLCGRYPHVCDRGYTTRPDWHAVAQDFDAVHLTEGGQCATRLSHPLDLYGWDCESTLWFRWAFMSAQHLGQRAWKPEPDAWWLDDEAELVPALRAEEADRG